MGKILSVNRLKDKYFRSKSKVVDWKISSWKETGLSYLEPPDGHLVEGERMLRQQKAALKSSSASSLW